MKDVNLTRVYVLGSFKRVAWYILSLMILKVFYGGSFNVLHPGWNDLSTLYISWGEAVKHPW